MDMNRKKWTLPVTGALLLVLGLVFAPGTFIAAAAETTVSVNGASGGAGDTIGVSVTIRGLDNLAGVTGISGGQFELAYDPPLPPSKHQAGSRDWKRFSVPGQQLFSEKSIKVVWAAESALITADAISQYFFSLHKSGAVNQSMKICCFMTRI